MGFVDRLRYKKEEVYRNEYQNATHALLAWPEYVEWYNTKCPHASLNYLSPVQFGSLHAKQAPPVLEDFFSCSADLCV